MATESTASTLQTCPACGVSIDIGDAEPLAFAPRTQMLPGREMPRVN